MSLSTEQMEALAKVLKLKLNDDLLEFGVLRYVVGSEVMAWNDCSEVDDWYLSLLCERIVIEKLKLDLSWTLSEEPYIWFDGKCFEGTLTQAIEAAVKAWLETHNAL